MNPAAKLVHVIDDDPPVRDSLRWLLEGEGLEVQTHASAEAFLAGFSSERPACAIVDLRMPGMSGLDLQEELLRRRARLPLVFVTAHGDVPLAVRAMRRGAVDFVEKPFSDEHLVQAVRRALDGLSGEPAATDASPGELRARAAALSTREREVLALVVDGQSSKSIAAALGIAIKTVEAHRARIMDKLGAASLAGLVRIVVHHGLLEPPQR